LIFNLILII